MKAWVIARRELAAYFLSPAAYLVMALFLLIEGYSFWLLVSLLNGSSTPHGAVLQYFFGGTFLYWLFVMFLVSVVTMRLIAEERMRGTLEPLLTAPVHPWEIVVGKFLGAVGFYAALWLPTLLYLVVLRSSAPEGTRLDLGPIAAGYLGTLLVGAGAIALGLLASVVTRNQILAAMVSFVTLTLLLLAGALTDSLVRPGPLRSLFDHLNLFRHMDDFGRGIVDTRRVVYHLVVVAIGLFSASRLLSPRVGLHRARAALEIGLIVGCGIAVNILSARHFHRGDWTGGHTFVLSEKSVQILKGLSDPVEVTVFMVPNGADGNDLYSDVRELCERARQVSPQLKVEYLDVDRDPDRLRTLGKRYNISYDDLKSGVVVVARAGQSKFITRDELADYDFSDSEDRAPRMKAWKGEAALDSALLSVTEARAPSVCFVSGHGEPAFDSLEPDGYGDFAEALRRDHYNPRAVEIEGGVPTDCDITVLAGPDRPLDPREVNALAHLLERGGRLLALLGPTFDAKVTRFAPIGVETLLERWGILLRDDLVVDEPRLPASVIAFSLSEGYADHPITAPLQHRRTLWSDVREVRAVSAPGSTSRELIHTSDAGWGETDLGVFSARAELSFDPKRDVKGPIAIAAAAERTEGTGKGARIVAIGSSAIAMNRQLGAYNPDLLLSSVAWLSPAAPKIALGPRRVEHLRLSLDSAQLSRLFFLCVLALPLLALALGGALFWIRRS